MSSWVWEPCSCWPQKFCLSKGEEGHWNLKVSNCTDKTGHLLFLVSPSVEERRFFLLPASMEFILSLASFLLYKCWHQICRECWGDYSTEKMWKLARSHPLSVYNIQLTNHIFFTQTSACSGIMHVWFPGHKTNCQIFTACKQQFWVLNPALTFSLLWSSAASICCNHARGYFC